MCPPRVEDNYLEVDAGKYGYVYSLNGLPFSGISYRLAPDGKLLYETEYLQGSRQVERQWYPSGQLRTENIHRDGTIYGSWREWFENGQIRQENLREHGVVIKKTEWDEIGNVIYEHEIDEQDEDFDLLQRLRESHSRWHSHQDCPGGLADDSCPDPLRR